MAALCAQLCNHAGTGVTAKSKIAFVRRLPNGQGTGQNIEVFVMDEDGYNPINVTNFKGDDVLPSWSPDGKRMAFVSSGRRLEDDGRIYVVNADGSHLTRLKDHPRCGSAPSWSPDGKLFAFVSPGGEELDIYLMQAASSGARRLTPQGTRPPGFPETRRAKPFVPIVSGEAGARVLVITTDDAPQWSPDGRWLAFLRSVQYVDRSGSERLVRSQLCVARRDGSAQKRLARLKVSPPFAWARDGERIVFVSAGHVYSVDRAGSHLKRLTQKPFEFSELAWSPDRKRLAFVSNKGGLPGGIHVMSVDGTQDKEIHGGEGGGWEHLAWSPDGTKIAFQWAPELSVDIFLTNADGSHLKRLTDHPHIDEDPVWQPRR